MLAIHPEFVIDEQAKKKAVILPFIEWTKILEILDEYEDIQAYDNAKIDKDEVVLFSDAVKEINAGNINEV